MAGRIVTLVGLSLLIVGGLVGVGQMSVAQAPPTPATQTPTDHAAPPTVAKPAAAPVEEPASQAAAPPAHAAPVPQAAEPVAAGAPAATPPPAPVSPAVTAPPAKAPAPVVTAPPTQTPAPIVGAPPAVKPAPVVDVPMPQPKPAISVKEEEKGVPAKFLFAAKKHPSTGKPMAIGYYPRGCLQGGVELPINGPHWEVMRLSRNRNWGHPELIRFLKRFSAAAAKATGWHGILIGDLAQPRGGPLPYGHTSHQIGLDVDIWYTPMPDRILTREEREDLSAIRLVDKGGLDVNKNWTSADAAFLRTVAEQPDVERVLVNAAIKKKMCELEGGHHYAWMAKLRPWYGHTSHIHVRLKCPADSPHCRHQPPVPAGDGCEKKDLAYWFSDRVLHPKPSKKPEKPAKQITMADMPAACQQVLNAPAKTTNLAADGRK
jgi:penicillin-insensitive murein endopeptidase